MLSLHKSGLTPFVLSVATAESKEAYPERSRDSGEVEGEVEGQTREAETMGFWVYILRCADNSYYIGHTDDLEYRMAQHESGEFGGYTATRKPIHLVFTQECATREEALGAERQLKGWSRKKKEAMIRGDWVTVNRLSRGKHRHEREDGRVQHPTPLRVVGLERPSTSLTLRSGRTEAKVLGRTRARSED